MSDGGWSLVVPVKPLGQAKSRLKAAAGDALRPALALAFAEDTVAAALACPAVGHVVIVTDDVLAAERLRRLGAETTPDRPGQGLNPALAHGAEVARRARPDAAVAALQADLPTLRAVELARVLEAAREHPRSFLADAAGLGTTLLAVAPQVVLAPRFGGGSRARHRASGAAELLLEGVDSVRHDVDTVQDLRSALALGLGPRTAAMTRGPLARLWRAPPGEPVTRE